VLDVPLATAGCRRQRRTARALVRDNEGELDASEPDSAGQVARVVVEALYQSLNPVHAATAARRDNDDARRFKGLYATHGAPVVAARAEVPVTAAGPKKAAN
jgi:hypothetical protein